MAQPSEVNWPLSADPPKFVYLIVATTEWPVDAIADGPHAVSHVQRVVEGRLRSGNVGGDLHRVKVFRARIDDMEEVEYLPATTVAAQLRPKSVDT